MKKLALVFVAMIFAIMACGGTTTTTRQPVKPACETVVYEVNETSGTVTAISITLHNATGDTEQGDYKVPFRTSFRMCDDWNFKYISAQIIRPTSGAGSIQCKITVDGEVVSTANASGFPSIAGCSD